MTETPIPTRDGYGGSSSRFNPDNPGSLPFTGLDLILLMVCAVLVVAAGVVLRRVGRERA